ncbi:MAG: hypothetical protein A2032_05095 [Chloroflexi bacterium RBG_19FT_COMBO_49_13]|nr:MAG: hypothetical protein A2Y53_04070 [Chloroflexi bacterium RBG_16_47_49]OGO62180.1 MAG: hypothetical protein A2032_05095 [Chloroflexi bacterium RBG_19FT_COMBO_49_13]
MKKLHILLVIILGLTLVACGPAQERISTNPEVASAKSQPTATQSQPVSDDMVRTDDQGAVEFSVQPLNLDSPGDSLTFEVSMNTHSVDLSMDLATLATLKADNGNSAQGVSWDGPLGGHHVSGKLTFPASNDGKPILDGATRLTLTIKNVDAPERIFTWELPK